MKRKCKKFLRNIREHWLCVTSGICIFVCIILISIYNIFGPDFFRLDQYAESICTMTAGIIGSMFGLTAASYAFRCGDLRSESQEKPHLQRILNIYMEDLWYYFIYALLFTVITILSSLLLLLCMQQFTSSISYNIFYKQGEKYVAYFTLPKVWLQCGVGFNAAIAIIDTVVMTCMNRAIFKREKKHIKIAYEILNELEVSYEYSDNLKPNAYNEEYEKIHNLEIIVKRILKNHESVGEAFSEELRRKNLLSTLIIQTLNNEYHIEGCPSEKMNSSYWKNLGLAKRNSRWDECREIAKRDYKSVQTQNEGKLSKCSKPEECNFIQVYDDLLTYRDCKLVVSTDHKQFEKKIFDGRLLRYTVKKRILWFYLNGEEFTDMDLSRISFSGADLRNANFSGSNLTKVRLKGTNCQGVDFSRTKLSGMYFCDACNDSREGEIQLTCMDDNNEIWDPYKGREITNLQEATFTGADVSRACLDASEAKRFSLQGTNFDNAKLFFSRLNNIDLNNASLGRAQIYNSALIDVQANASNFAGSVMTNCCIVKSKFRNANFEDTSLVETALYKSDFTGAKLTAANFAYSNIYGCRFDETSCQNASFKNAAQKVNKIREILPAGEVDDTEESISFKFATLTRTDFSGANLDRISFENVIGSECIFSQARGKRAIFDRAMLLGSVFNNTIFTSCSFKGTIFRNSIINNSNFINCCFVGTDFSCALFDENDEAYFQGGMMLNVNFSRCQGLRANYFQNCCLIRVDFSETALRKIEFLNCKVRECIFG